MANLAPIHGLDQTVTIQRPAATAGTAGGVSRAWNTHLANIAARIQPISTTEGVQFGRDGQTRVFRVIVEKADIVEGDRINWTSEGKLLDITEIKNLQYQNHTLSMTAQEVEL